MSLYSAVHEMSGIAISHIKWLWCGRSVWSMLSFCMKDRVESGDLDLRLNLQKLCICTVVPKSKPSREHHQAFAVHTTDRKALAQNKAQASRNS
jgi:hypothetical protein